MSGFILHSSNRLEILIDELAGLIAAPLPDPLDSEIILVQSKGMERWVSMELAQRHGVCANCKFTFPNSYIGEIFGLLLPPVLKDSPFEPQTLSWIIMDALPHFLDRPAFTAIRDYIEEGPEDFKLYQLSRKIADVFDQYLLFRPRIILEWETGRAAPDAPPDAQWQAQLWRELSGKIKFPHRAALLKNFLVKAARTEISHTLPARISVFGISALPPFHLEALNAVSRLTDVNLFVMNPCQEYWGDIELRGERRDKTVREYSYRGNSLLASMGKLGRDFFEMLQDLECDARDEFISPGRMSLLHSVQSDILELREGPAGNAGDPPAPSLALSPDLSPDLSIEIHSCHSPLREIEVLQDNILALLEARPDIGPRDILVMMPDIESYALFIDAVFSLPESDPRMVPFSIADKGIVFDSRTVSSFLGLLDIPFSRFGAGRIMEVLESEEIRQRFSLSEPEVETVRQWVRGARINWGLDGAHREALGVKDFAQNTWRAGLDRMLLGYALPEKNGELFCGVLPFDRIEGGDSEILGKFLAFTETLFKAAREMTRERTLPEWSAFLTEMVGNFFSARDDNSSDLGLLRAAILELKKSGERLKRKVGLDIVRDCLKRRLEVEGFGGSFLSGGITFCAMLPMRSIPFKVICLLGMDDGAYPRESTPPGFDLIAKDLRPGDRSRRFDDKYLFLETLVSAREKLYLSYVGQDIRDNSELPPSSLVSELLDYLSSRYGTPDITVKHALQAFNPQYFQNGRLVSYSRENYEAARRLYPGKARAGFEFFPKPLSEPGPEYRNVPVDELCLFFANPARFILSRRLGIVLEDRLDVLDEREMFSVEGLARYELESDLLEMALQGTDIQGELEGLKAGGLIPPGTPGACWFEDTCGSIERLAARVMKLRAGEALQPFRVDLSVGGFRITGTIPGLYPGGFIGHRMRTSERSLLAFWIRRLILDCAASGHVSPVAAFCCGDGDCFLRCPDDSPAIVNELLEVYWAGLHRPVPFFPQASWAYAAARLSGKEDAVEKARDKFEGSDYARGEIDDPYIRRCFSGSEVLEGGQFAGLAVKIIGPILDNADFDS